jgi:hypothetical protein
MDYYNKDTVDAKLNVINAKLDGQDLQRDSMHETIILIDKKIDGVIAQVKFTNGKVKLHEKILLVVGAIVFTLLIVNGSPFVAFLNQLIK